MTLKGDWVSYDKNGTRKNAQICPLTFLSLYAIKTHNVIYELRYLIL